MLFLLPDSPLKLKLEKVCGALVVFLYVSLSSPPLQSHFRENAKILPHHPRDCYNFRTKFDFFIRNTKSNHSLASDWWENTKSSFKDNSRTFYINSTIKFPPLKKI